MKKSRLIVGILLMILGIGISIGSVVLRHYEYGRYGIINYGHKVNRRGAVGGNWFGDSHQRQFNIKPNQNQGQNPNPQPNQNQNNGQNSNGGAKQ